MSANKLFRLGVYEVRPGKPVQVWNMVLDRCIGTFDSQKAARSFVEETAVNRALINRFGAEAAAEILDDERKPASETWLKPGLEVANHEHGTNRPPGASAPAPSLQA